MQSASNFLYTDESHVRSLMTALDLASDVVRVDWYILGVYLGVKVHILDEIREDHSTSTRRCKLNMLIAWLKSSEEPCTKPKLMTALWYITHSDDE